jgi:methylmalonyl-CoA carboxyltransferase 12S subunit
MIFVIAGATFVAGWAAGYLATRKLVRQELEGVRSRIDEIAERTRNGSYSAAALVERSGAPPLPTAAPADTAPARAAESPAAEPVVEEGVTPEVLMVISAAVAAFFGKRARVRRARLMPVAGVSPWAQQGRVFIQASHNLNR